MNGRHRIFEIGVLSLCASMILAYFLSSFSSSNWFWGFNLLYFFSPMYRRVILGIGILLCIPVISRTIVRQTEDRLSETISRVVRKVDGRILWLLVSFLSFAFFWILRTKTHFLGDGYVRIGALESNRVFTAKSLLDHTIASGFYRLLGRHFEVSAGDSCALLSCLYGVLFVLGVFILASLATRDVWNRLFVIAVFLSLGTVAFFFGYVEAYQAVTVAILFYVIASLYYLRCKCSLLIPLSVFTLAVLLHLTALCLLPSLIFLLLYTGRNMFRKSEISRSILIALAFCAVGYAVVSQSFVFLADYFKISDISPSIWYLSPERLIHYVGENLVPFTRSAVQPGGYTIYSAVHFSNVVNELLLVSPLLFPLMFVSIFPFARRFCKDDFMRFLIIASIPLLLLNLTFNPRIGAARDWDLFAAGGVAYGALIVFFFLQLFTTCPKVKYVMVPLLFVSVSHTIPWILTNASDSRGLGRFELMLESEPTWSNYALGYGHYTLYVYHRKEGNLSEATGRLKQALGFVENPLYRIRLASIYLLQGLSDDALHQCREALQNRSLSAETRSDVHTMIGMIQLEKRSFREAEENLLRATQLNSSNAQAYSNLGILYYSLGLYDYAEERFLQATEVDPHYVTAHLNLGMLYARMASESKAEDPRKTVELARKAKLHYEQSLKHWSGPLKERRDVEARIERLKEFANSPVR